jgi:hypothetical protein
VRVEAVFIHEPVQVRVDKAKQSRASNFFLGFDALGPLVHGNIAQNDGFISLVISTMRRYLVAILWPAKPVGTLWLTSRKAGLHLVGHFDHASISARNFVACKTS